MMTRTRDDSREPKRVLGLFMTAARALDTIDWRHVSVNTHEGAKELPATGSIRTTIPTKTKRGIDWILDYTRRTCLNCSSRYSKLFGDPLIMWLRARDGSHGRLSRRPCNSSCNQAIALCKAVREVAVGHWPFLL